MTRNVEYEGWSIRRNRFIQMALFGLYETVEFQSNGDYSMKDNSLVNHEYNHIEIRWNIQWLREFPSIAHLNSSIHTEE